MPAKTTATIRHSPMEHPRHQYPQETEALCQIARSCNLVEQIKWGKPCFVHHGKNIVLVQRFNRYIALLFFKGALLQDPERLLVRVGEHMQAPRQLRFTTVDEIHRLQPAIVSWIHEAIELEKAGAKIERTPRAEPALPPELLERFTADVRLQQAFASLTPGRQRGYLFQIAAARQSATRVARIEKFTPKILSGKGWNE